jgi:hypothetical protein
MTASEQKALNEISLVLRDMRTSNNEFRSSINEMVTKVSDRVDKKHLPVNLESDILSTVQSSIQKSIGDCLAAYNSPLLKLVSEVVSENSSTLKSIISDSFKQVISTDDFKLSIVSAFSHKVARTIISNNDGLFDKVSNELKQDNVFKAKMAVAVANVVEECLNKQ